MNIVSFRNKNHGCPGYKIVALKPFRTILFFCFIAILFSTLLPAGDVHALTSSVNGPDLPTLETFIEQVKNDRADQLRGIYIPGVLAARIVQQTSGSEGFVSPWENVLTQFDMASRLGSTGLLAHNYLAGKWFAELQPGQTFYLVYGDGRTAAFTVSESLQYQALEPNAVSGKFVDLRNGRSLTHAELFTEIYNRKGQVIFQTCIEAENNPTWGRLFVIAEPH